MNRDGKDLVDVHGLDGSSSDSNSVATTTDRTFRSPSVPLRRPSTIDIYQDSRTPHSAPLSSNTRQQANEIVSAGPNVDRQITSFSDIDLAKKLLETLDGNLDRAMEVLVRASKISTAVAKSYKMPETPVLIEMSEISKTFRLGKHKVEALKSVSLKIHEGEFIAITGASGSGKSTLLQLIGGLDKPTSGQIIVDSQNISKLSDRKLSSFRNKTIGFVFQFFYLQPFLNLQTNLEVPGMFARTPRKARRSKSGQLAKAVGLDDRLKHFPRQMSGGQMQRAAVARALFNQPKLILADEPTGNLDSENGRAIINLFEKIRKEFGTTIVIVTHDEDISSRADRKIVVKDGKIVE